MKRLLALSILVLILTGACQASTPTTQAPSPTLAVEPYPAGGYPVVSQPVDMGTYPLPTPEVTSVNLSAYPAPGEPSPYDPQSSDATLKRADATVDFSRSEIRLLETTPVQAVLMMIVQLPTPCHQPRVKVSAPDAQKNIAVEVFAVVDTTTICTQVIAQTEVRVSLGSLAAGTYQVAINGEAFKPFTLK